MVTFTTVAVVAISAARLISARLDQVPHHARALEQRAASSCTWPTASKTIVLSTPSTIKKGTAFDGKMVRYETKGGCTGQTEGGDKDAVFLVEDGATVKNVIIGKNQAEGIHCLGACTIDHVWFEDVCEDAITIKQKSGTSYIVGGGAKSADDKVIQFNGGGTVEVNGYCVKDAGKLIRACGNCKSGQGKRLISLKNITATNVKLLAGINSNYGDVATIDMSTISVSSVKSICDTFEGNSSGKEPKKLTSNVANANCKF